MEGGTEGENWGDFLVQNKKEIVGVRRALRNNQNRVNFFFL